MEAIPAPTHLDVPDVPDWFRQSAHTLHSVRAKDPVRTVWQLPRLRLGSRRYTGRIDHALVCVTRKGSYDTFLPPARPASVRRYVAVYEVSTDPHTFQLEAALPSDVDSHEFEVIADITWRVVEPALFVQSQERDVPGLLTRALLPVMRAAGRSYPIAASADAEQAVQRAVNTATPIGAAEGLHVTCVVRLRRDVVERSHQERLRTARHEVEAARPEHQAAILRQQHEAQLTAERIAFYEGCLARGDTAALALHLTRHPDDTQHVLEHLRTERAALTEAQLHLIDQVLGHEEHKGLEDYQLEEPHRLMAERMTAILKASADPGGDEERRESGT